MSPQYKRFRDMLREAGMSPQTLGRIECDLIAVQRPDKPPVLCIVNDKGEDGYSLFVLAPGIKIEDDVHRMKIED